MVSLRVERAPISKLMRRSVLQALKKQIKRKGIDSDTADIISVSVFETLLLAQMNKADLFYNQTEEDSLHL